jgi:hypothetical protein
MGVQRRCGGHRVDVEEVLGPVDRRSDDPAARGEDEPVVAQGDLRAVAADGDDRTASTSIPVTVAATRRTPIGPSTRSSATRIRCGSGS